MGGREEVRAAEERLQGCKGNHLEGIKNTRIVVYRAKRGNMAYCQMEHTIRRVNPCEYGEERW